MAQVFYQTYMINKEIDIIYTMLHGIDLNLVETKLIKYTLFLGNN